ncbi:hypothetical protein EBQ34_01170 [Vandammella animalimorsus]|uniref:Uncharacterized protein n=2 Tax=Vandammella animalimorsus TaxID=2029117 RepID=A0A3M6RVS8_9BURK|nr:hypothetical protein EBQ34_01170 [Vandammella animalimorsus]
MSRGRAMLIHMQVKNLRGSAEELVYQGPSALEVHAMPDEDSVGVYVSDPGWKNAACTLLLEPQDARRLAEQLLQQAAVVQCQ